MERNTKYFLKEELIKLERGEDHNSYAQSHEYKNYQAMLDDGYVRLCTAGDFVECEFYNNGLVDREVLLDTLINELPKDTKLLQIEKSSEFKEFDPKDVEQIEKFIKSSCITTLAWQDLELLA